MAIVVDQALLFDVEPYRIIESHPGRKSIVFNNFYRKGYTVFTAIIGLHDVITRLELGTRDELWEWLKNHHGSSNAMGKCFCSGKIRDIQVVFEKGNNCYRIMPIYGGEVYDEKQKWDKDGGRC